MQKQVYQTPIQVVNNFNQSLLDVWATLDQRIIDNAVALNFGRQSSNTRIFLSIK